MAIRSIEFYTQHVLQLASNFQPEVNQVFSGNGLACFGMPGSGKSNFLALLCEQYAPYRVPLVLIDTEGEASDLLSVFTRGVLADRFHLPDPHAILHAGLQVVFNLKSWNEDYESAGNALCDLVEGLFRVAGQQHPADRVPCPILMDEAATWVPRRTKTVASFSKDLRMALLTIFEQLGARGRKYGLIPHYFTQFISQIDADIVRPCALRVLMKQASPLDFKRYADYVTMTKELRATIQNFLPGQALIAGLGEPLLVRFFEQETDHPSQTPMVEAALSKFGNLPALPPTLESTGPATILTFRSVLSPCKEKILACVDRFAENGMSPNLRDFTRHLKMFSAEQLASAVAELVASGQLLAEQGNRTTRYHRPV